MRRVIIETPYAATDQALFGRNRVYTQCAMRDSLSQGEAPLASHVLYALSGVLDDTVKSQRTLGISAGLEWAAHAEATVAYTDLGVSPGMQLGIDAAARAGRPVVSRSLPIWRPHEGLIVTRACPDESRTHYRMFYESTPDITDGWSIFSSIEKLGGSIVLMEYANNRLSLRVEYPAGMFSVDNAKVP